MKTMQTEGFHKTHPVIKGISFMDKDKMSVVLKDGREILVPLKYFPSIKKLNSKQRMQYTIIGDEGIMFKYADFIYHIQDFLGKEQEYCYAGTFSHRR